MKIFIGYDRNEIDAFRVCVHSILKLITQPVELIPIGVRFSPKEYTRPRGPYDSTEFSNIRFLVPYLCNYEGQAIFMDCDMLVQTDLSQLLRYSNKPVYCVKHSYIPINDKKFLDQDQHKYSRKNWSSLMVFNNEKCKSLTLDYCNNAPGLDLHQFKWADDVGELDKTWNWLVGEYEDNYDANILHYTLGGPWFGYPDMAEPWLKLYLELKSEYNASSSKSSGSIREYTALNKHTLPSGA